MAIIQTLWWAFANCLVQFWPLRWFFGGWCWIAKNDLRFSPPNRVITVAGNPSVSDTGVDYALRGKWQETWAVFTVEVAPGLLYCDDFMGRRLTYWASLQGIKPKLLQPGDQVACKVAAHDADWGLLGWLGNNGCMLTLVDRCSKDDLAKYPDAKRI